MAISTPGIGYLRGYDGKADMVAKFGEGFDLARNLRDEAAAPDLIAELMRLSATPQAQAANGRLSAGPQATAALPAAAPAGGAGGVLDVLEQVAGAPVSAQPAGPREPWFSPSRIFAAKGQTPAAVTAPTGVPVAAAADPMAAYIASVEQSESGGNPNARNPNSSATGPFQFIEGTWQGLMRDHPDLGLTADGRTDPAQSARAMARFTQENAKVLQGAGVPVTPGSLYATHFLGAGASPRVLSANPATPMTALVDPDVIAANPHLADMTQAEFVDWSNRQGTKGKSGGYSAPTAGPGGAMPTPMRAVPRPAPEMMAKLFSNRATRPLAQALLAQQTAQVDQYQTFVGDDGVTYQTNLLNGQTSVLRDPVKGAAAANKAPEVVTRYNAETGLEEKVTWDETLQDWKPFGGQKATTASTRPMNPTTQKELFEADDMVTAGGYALSALENALNLNATAYDGPLADFRGAAAALAGSPEGIATAELKNQTTELALTQLKTIFGGMPTEGERKILLELQGSVDQPRKVREAIYKRAMQMAQRRIDDNKRKAAAIRSGEFFEEGYDSGGGAAVPGDDGELTPGEVPPDDVEQILRGVGVL